MSIEGRWARVVEGACATPSVCQAYSTNADGNVDSSIYYAFGLVAEHALGLTRLAFTFPSGLFAVTTKTYVEGASMFPEVRGSSNFAFRRLHEARLSRAR